MAFYPEDRKFSLYVKITRLDKDRRWPNPLDRHLDNFKVGQVIHVPNDAMIQALIACGCLEEVNADGTAL